MKLYKLSMIALALAGVFTACSDNDDVKYVAAEQVQGVYLPVSGEMTVLLTEGAGTVDVPVYRTMAGSAQTLQVEATFSEDGIFTCDPQVTFDASSKVGYLKVSYNPSSIQMDHPYTCELTLPADQVSQYGLASSTVTLLLKSPTVTVDGPKGTYTYSQFFEGADSGLETTISHPETSETVLTYRVQDWAMGVELPIEVHTDLVDDYGNYICFVPETYIGYEHSSYGSVYVCDIYTYTENPNYYDYSFYDPNSGLFSLNVVYFVSAGVFGNGYEFFQLDGFPDFSISTSYQGLFTEASGLRSYAVVSVSVGPDVQEAWIANVEGEPTQEVVDQMTSGAMDVQTLNAGEDQELRFEVPGDGVYTVYALAMSDGELQNLAYDTYTIKTSSAADQGDWTSIGYLPFVDGWIIPWFGENPFEYAEYIPVEVQVSEENPNLLRLKNPYNLDFYSSVNKGTGIASIDIDVTDPDMVYVYPQYSGFTYDMGEWKDWYVADIAGFYLSLGVEIEDVAAYVQDNELNGTFSDGVIELPIALVGPEDDCEYSPADADGNFAGYPVVIDLNELQQTAPARMAAPACKAAPMHVNDFGCGLAKFTGNTDGKKVRPMIFRKMREDRIERNYRFRNMVR